jgi:hypothetical protein
MAVRSRCTPLRSHVAGHILQQSVDDRAAKFQLGQRKNAVEIGRSLDIFRSAVDKYANKAKQKWISNCNGCNAKCVISDRKKDMKVMCARHERGLLGLRRHREIERSAK